MSIPTKHDRMRLYASMLPSMFESSMDEYVQYLEGGKIDRVDGYISVEGRFDIDQIMVAFHGKSGKYNFRESVLISSVDIESYGIGAFKTAIDLLCVRIIKGINSLRKQKREAEQSKLEDMPWLKLPTNTSVTIAEKAWEPQTDTTGTYKQDLPSLFLPPPDTSS